MGKRGRPTNTQRAINNFKEQYKPAPLQEIGTGMVMPNHSGISVHPEMLGDKGFVKKTGDTMTGALDIIHASTEADDHSLEIDVNAAGFGDVKALDIVYVTGAITDGLDEEVILINIDQTASLGGDIHGVEVLTTEGLASVFGLEVGAQVGPIEQLSGAFVDMDSILVAGVDKLTLLQDGGAGNVSMFVLDDDTVIIGDVALFEEMEFILSTTSSGSGIKPKFEFSNGTGFTEFTPADGTNGFRNTGVMMWSLDDIPSWAQNSGEFLIKITRERMNLTTTPICDKVQIVKGTEFSWNKDGDISNRDISCRNITPSGTVDGVDIAARDHAESHTVVSHSDTTGTGAELDTLTDNSMADTLHRHSELSASDGTPDQALVVDSSGQVGIGKSDPEVELHVIGGTIRLDNTAGGATFNARVFSTSDGHQAGLNFHKSSSATIGTFTETAINEDIGELRFRGVDSNDAVRDAALIMVEQDAVAGTSAVPGRLAFHTSDATSLKERMRIDSAGNVGIGTTPTANMTGMVVQGGAYTMKEITTPTADTNYGKIYTKTDNKLYFQDGAGTEHEIAFV